MGNKALALIRTNVERTSPEPGLRPYNTVSFEMKYQFLRQAVLNGQINTKRIPTKNNVADDFTKALPRDVLQALSKVLGMSSRCGSHEQYP